MDGWPAERVLIISAVEIIERVLLGRRRQGAGCRAGALMVVHQWVVESHGDG